MKKDSLITFLAGMAAGALLSILVGEEDKKKMQQTLKKEAARLRKEYEGPIKAGTAKAKQFIQTHLK